MGAASSVVGRWVVVVVVVFGGLVAGSFVVGVGRAGGRAAAPRLVDRGGDVGDADSVRDAVARTVAARSARLEGRYVPATGPPVIVRGRVSFVGPAAEVEAGVEGGPRSRVVVTASGEAWLLAPGESAWVAVPAEATAQLAPERGWGPLLRDLEESSDVSTDDAGRIVRARLVADRAGGTLDVRFTDFGVEVAVAVPP